MELPLAIVLFFVGHWTLSVFFQTFFLHRYGAHRMFTLSKGWERFFHLCTFVFQGSSYLNPRGYAILHRMHHAYSDTEKDPHSPVIFKNPFAMMNHTRDIYRSINLGTFPVEERFDGGYPDWPVLDRIAGRWLTSLCWGTAYTAFYLVFATQWWHFLLLPIHFLMGPVHGAIVNWFGHWAGYRNFDSKDASRNTLIFDFVTLGELFQNNHHKYGMRPNFAVRWFEIDPTWWAIRLFAKLGILKLRDERLLNAREEREATHVTDELSESLPAAEPAE
ncbi:MAG: acyl-CoA desaturase [Myxococcales bacterium]|nr:acyl-CoA desaturase [Myxococcales bacterium]